ncbi:MAG: hypothetical protein RR690_02390, partial [Longicatena sp.]
MENYVHTFLWKKTLGNNEENKEDIELLRVTYELFRKNAIYIADEIAKIMPDYTVHNITHIDALWEMCDIFLPKDYPINPAEAFVLGGAFLLHDLGMSIVAYPNGMESIKKEVMWNDTVAAL